MFSEFKQIMEQTLQGSGRKVAILACSGGVDSMVMLHLFQRFVESKALKLVVAHVNHHLRSSADEDEAFLQKYADEQGLEIAVRHASVAEIAEESDKSIEMVARKERYRLLEEIRAAKDGDMICTAHTQSDQAETVLMRIINGTGVRGARGIHQMRGKIFRPMLSFSREEIEEYAEVQNIPYREDPSNTDQSIERNWIRYTLLPLIKDKVNPNATEALAHFATVQSEVSTYLKFETEKALETLIIGQSRDEIVLDIRGFRNYFTALRKNIILECLTILDAPEVAMSYPRMEQLLDIIIDGASGQTMRLPGDIHLVRDRKQMLFSKGDWQEAFTHEFRPSATASLGKYEVQSEETKTVTESDLKSPNEWDAYFDLDAIAGRTLVWRSWEDGDTMQLKGGATKKVSDIFVDTKTPMWKKHQLPLLAEGANILWIPGVKRSGLDWITENTELYLKIAVRRIQ